MHRISSRLIEYFKQQNISPGNQLQDSCKLIPTYIRKESVLINPAEGSSISCNNPVFEAQ